MKALTTITLAVALLTLSMFGHLPVSSAEEGTDIEQLITTAKTPADHEAIAAYYDKEAKEAHEKHAKHQKMEEFYKKNAALNKSGFGAHCDIIAANFDKTAKEYEALAKLHRDMATSAK